MTSPRQIFEDNIYPADLLLQVYRLLDTNDQMFTEGELVEQLRLVLNAKSQEYLMLIYNDIFLGLVREKAHLPVATLRRSTLGHLLRQAVVVSCTAMDTYLPALLKANLSITIRAKGRDFIPVSDGDVMRYFSLKGMTFSLEETMRLISETNYSGNVEYASSYIANKILSVSQKLYLSTSKGVHVVGVLLGIEKPWDRIVEHLGRDYPSEEASPGKSELQSILDTTVDRRNNIVHRGDRNVDDPEGEPEEITYAWTRQAVDTVEHVCIALDELVTAKMEEYRAIVEA
jgi:hypothetical protein